MKRFLLILMTAVLLGGPVMAAPLVVATKEAPPFAMKSTDGEWVGIAIDLWRGIAADLGRPTEFRELTLEALLQSVADGEVDAGMAAVTVTAEREARVDFAHPFYTSGLGIAVPAGAGRSKWLALLQALFSWTFVQGVLALAGVLLVAAVAVWLFERKANAKQFGGRGLAGLGHSFWWSAVTMTTVGYGDVAPRTVAGRAVALVWMFTSVIIISSFTATIASSLTEAHFQAMIRGVDDLQKVRVVTLAGTTSETYLREHGIHPVVTSSLGEALDDLVAGRVGAVVYDAPMLRYGVNRAYAGQVHVVPGVFARQD
ncbi:transporter substrate-binding domain-containing protein, partial [bacterium]|nr:transporter substrate-binding domain-containing protein [bacterium]